MDKEIKCEEFEAFKAEINTQIEQLKKDAIEFYYKDNATAGLRLRKALKLMKIYVYETSKATLKKKNNVTSDNK